MKKSVHQSSRSPEEIRAEIAHQKHEIADTYAAAKDSVSTDEVLTAGADYVKEKADTASKFVSEKSEAIGGYVSDKAGAASNYVSDKAGAVSGYVSDKASAVSDKSADVYQSSKGFVQQNPIPVALATAGIVSLITAGWKMNSSGSTNASQGNYSTSNRSYTGVGSNAGSSRQGGSESHWQDSVKSTAKDAQNRVTRTGQKVSSSLQSMVQDRPVLTALLGAAAGALIGGALPRTKFEDEKVGPIRDKSMQQAQQSAEQIISNAKEAASQTIEDQSERVKSSIDDMKEDSKPSSSSGVNAPRRSSV